MHPNLRESAAAQEPRIGDPLALLMADHEEVSNLFEQFETALEDESGNLQLLADQICRELEVHTVLEEEIFYPALRQHPALEALVEESLAAHGEVKDAIERIRGMDATDPEFGPTMLQLMDEVDRHVSEEENVLFPQVEEHLPEQLGALAERLEMRQRELKSA